ncbi:uncharacterized protein FFB14_05944 [Fusarium fujikuroi]|nr:uncharacterized protein FFB14_05944 [Fusarium fujikuroi]
MVEVDARTAVGGGHLCSSDWGASRGASHENYGKAAPRFNCSTKRAGGKGKGGNSRELHSFCIGAAASTAGGLIYSCSAVALRANNLRVGGNTSPQAAEVSGAVVIAELLACSAKPLTGFLVVTGVCLKATGN